MRISVTQIHTGKRQRIPNPVNMSCTCSNCSKNKNHTCTSSLCKYRNDPELKSIYNDGYAAGADDRAWNRGYKAPPNHMMPLKSKIRNAYTDGYAKGYRSIF